MNDYTPLHIKKHRRIKTRIKHANRRAKRFGTVGTFTIENVVDLYDRQRGRCACCGVLLNFYYSIDHIIALSKGGSNSAENLQLLLPFCNSLKGNKSMEEYLTK